MFKIYKGNKSRTPSKSPNYSSRDSHASDGTPHRPGKQRDLILTNILEESSTVDEPRSFEQDEQYLDECLKALDENAEELQVGEGDLEEYDFDDYNSIASTASLLNIHAELAQDEKNFAVRNHVQTPTNETMALKTSQSRSTGMHETVVNGEDRSQAHLREQLLRISKVQASISKVRNWSKCANGSLNKEEWKDLLLEAAQQGDLKRVQEVYSKLGGTSELAIRITDSFANTAVHKAAESGNLPCLQWLVEQLPNDCLRNITNHDNLTPLAVAVTHGNVQCVQWLLEETSAAEEMSDNATRAALMHLTIQSGQDACLGCLLAHIRDKFLDLDVTDSSGVTLAHVAAREGHMTCLQTLVDHNIDVTIEDKDGRSPADYAYAAGQSGCGRYLVMEESCWLLSVRIAKLHRELKDCKDENKELRQKLQVLESRATSGMPDRPEAVGGDQSDTSTGTSKSLDDRLGTKMNDSPRSDRRRASGSPDGESPKGFGHDRPVYQYHVNGSEHNPDQGSPFNRFNGSGMTFVNKETEVKSARQFEALKQQRRLSTTRSIDSAGSGVCSPMSLTDAATDHSAMQLVMAKQIAANTRRLVMSKHSQKVEESPLIGLRVIPTVYDGGSVNEPRGEVGPSLQVLQPDTYYSPSSSRSHSPTRTDSTSGSRPTSGTPREDFREIKRTNAVTTTAEKRNASEDRTGTPSRIRSLANRRKPPSLSSDSTLSSDSEFERSSQQNNGPRHRRGYPPSSRSKELNGNGTVLRQGLHRRAPVDKNRAKKTVSWNESLKANLPTNVNKQIPNEKPRIPPKPPVRTVSRDSRALRTKSRDGGVEMTFSADSVAVKKLRESERTILRDSGTEMFRSHGSESGRIVLRDSDMFGYGQVDRNPARNGVDRFVVPSVVVQQPIKPVAGNSGPESLSYSLDGYQQDDRPWYETDEFD